MLAKENALQQFYGITDEAEWTHWVFIRSIYLEEDENEDDWLQRVLHTTDAIIQQQHYIQNHPTYTLTEKEKSLNKLKKRLGEIVKTLGYLPSSDNLLAEYEEDIEQLVNRGVCIKPVKRRKTTNNLTKLIAVLLETEKVSNVSELWSYFRSNTSIDLEDLVIVHSIGGNDSTATMEWSDGEGGKIKNISRASVGKKISKVRKILNDTQK